MMESHTLVPESSSLCIHCFPSAPSREHPVFTLPTRPLPTLFMLLTEGYIEPRGPRSITEGEYVTTWGKVKGKMENREELEEFSVTSAISDICYLSHPFRLWPWP